MESRTQLGSHSIPSKPSFGRRGSTSSGSDEARKRSRAQVTDFCGLDFNAHEAAREAKKGPKVHLSERLKQQELRKPEKPMMDTHKRKKAKPKQRDQHLLEAMEIQGDTKSTRIFTTTIRPKPTNGVRDPCTPPDALGKESKPPSLTSAFMGQLQHMTTVRTFHHRQGDGAFENVCDSDSVTDEESHQPKQRTDLKKKKKSRSSDAAVRASPAGSTSTIGATSYVNSFEPFDGLSRAQPPSSVTKRSNRNVFGKGQKKFKGKKIDPVRSFLDKATESPQATGLTGLFGPSSPERNDFSSSNAENQRKALKDRATTPRKRQSNEEILVDSPEPPPRRRSARKTKSRVEVIEIDDESEAEEYLDQVRTYRDSQEVDSLFRCQKGIFMELSRIAVGKKVFREGCQATFAPNDGYLTLSYKTSLKKTRSTKKYESKSLQLTLDADNLREIKYFNEEESTLDEVHTVPSSMFLSLRILKNNNNGLTEFANAYDPDSQASEEKRFLVLEFCDDETFRTLLMKLQESMPQFVNEFSQIRSAKDASQFCATLAKDNGDQKKQNLRRNGKKCAFLEDKNDDSVLVVYPFEGESKTIDEAGKDLSVLSCSSETGCIDAPTENESTQQIVVLAGDYERLEPEVYLNDTIIDFFCQWIFRRNSSQDVHVFTSHFYSTLEKYDGIEKVASWTQRRKIDIFQKKLIIIPVNKHLHWSLCVVVNPAYILSHVDHIATGEELSAENAKKPMPCIVFLDSLKAHGKNKVGANIRKWLNAEWDRKERKDTAGNTESTSQANIEKVFTAKTMKISSPIVPYQTNGWDCGVFVCRYAYGFKCIQSRLFSYDEAGYMDAPNKPDAWLKHLISNSEAFRFGDEEIASLREDMKTLIERLYRVYDPWSKEQKRKRKTDKEHTKQTTQSVEAANGPLGSDSAGNCTGKKVEEKSNHHALLAPTQNQNDHYEIEAKNGTKNSPFKPHTTVPFGKCLTLEESL